MSYIEQAIRRFLLEQEYDLNNENFSDTPVRFERVLNELVTSRKKAIEYAVSHLDKTFSVDDSRFTGMLISSADLVTLCPHHLLPVELSINFAYIPGLEVVGLSKITRYLQELGRALWLQEEFTEWAVDLFFQKLQPSGCMIVVKGRHGCMVFRGVRDCNSSVVTSAVRGCFQEEKVKMEALALMMGKVV